MFVQHLAFPVLLYDGIETCTKPYNMRTCFLIGEGKMMAIVKQLLHCLQSIMIWLAWLSIQYAFVSMINY